MILKPGTYLKSRYEILSMIGEGGYGAIYRAMDNELNREVAIKIPKFSLDQSPEEVVRFKREAKYVAQLLHSNIVQVYSIDLQDNGIPFIVMEHLEGKTLKGILNERNDGLSFEECKLIFDQICSALAYAHKLGIIHRDLSTSNIFLVDQGTNMKVKIIDFGLAKLFEKTPWATQTITKTGVLIGNPTYMSPEACRGQRAGPQTDIYSLGCVLYEMINGRPVFESDNPIGFLHLHQFEYPVDPNPSWHSEDEHHLKKVALKCLQKRPESRFQSILEIISAPGQPKVSQNWKLDAWQKSNQQRIPKLKTNLPLVILLTVFCCVVGLLSFRSFFPTDRHSTGGLRKRYGHEQFVENTIMKLLDTRYEDGSHWVSIKNCIEASRLTEDVFPNDYEKKIKVEMALGESLLFTGLPRQALDTYTRVIESVSKSRRISAQKDLDGLRFMRQLCLICVEASPRAADHLIAGLSPSDSFYGTSLLAMVESGLRRIDDRSVFEEWLLHYLNNSIELLQVPHILFSSGRLHAAEKFIGKADILSARDYFGHVNLGKARLLLYRGEDEKAQQILKKIDLATIATDPNSDHINLMVIDMGLIPTLKNADWYHKETPNPDRSLEHLKEMLLLNSDCSELIDYIGSLIANQPKRDELIRLLCLRAELGGRFASVDASYAYHLCTSKTPREARLRSKYFYAKALNERGYFLKSRKLFAEILQDLNIHGFPKHEDYGLPIDQQVIDNSNAGILLSYINGMDKDSSKYFQQLLKQPIRGELASALIRADYTLNKAANLSEIIASCNDVAATRSAARILIRNGELGLARQTIKRGRDINEILSKKTESDGTWGIVDWWESELDLAALEAFSFLESHDTKSARDILHNAMKKLYKGNGPFNTKLEMLYGDDIAYCGAKSEDVVSRKKLRSCWTSRSECRKMFIAALELAGMHESTKKASKWLKALFG